MSKERELLERALGSLDAFYGVGGSFLADEIRAYLADPEKKREPLSEEVIYREAYRQLGRNPHIAFENGVRFAEKQHGIGGEDQHVGKTDKFIRLSEDEVAALRYRFLTNEIVTSYELICATENKLAEKNGEAA